ncbi:site-specific integrase [Haloferax sp. DFSO52]|uniref:site-specific integrase n=1 Tax=Haloferax sp. DFSO52 TaxID=3388505 RepID=UPI003A84A539
MDIYWQDIAPKRLRDGYDEDRDVPRYEWLTEHGFSGIAYALREHHDLTLTQFFVDVVGLEDDDADEWEWGIDHDATVDALDAYLTSISTRGGRAESTVDTHRTRLSKWVRTYRELHETDALLEPLTELDTQPREIERCLAVLDVFDEDLSTDRSKLEYLHVARAWYSFVKRRKYAKYNPIAEAGEEFGWEASEPDPQALSASQVRRIYGEVDAPEAELLVVALAGWGLRPSEVASLHAEQVVLDADDPHLSFGDGERKNGPGEVTLLYGVDIVADRIDRLADRTTWNRYLFPSRSSSTGHVSVSTVRRRFKQLADRAGVVVDGDTPTPKMGRRFWYSAYQEAVGEVLEGLEGVAEDQGSSSTEVVLRNYLSREQERKARRRRMYEKLEAAFNV